MVDEREAECQIRPRALRERAPLGTAEAGGGVGDVADERQDRARALGHERPVERLHDRSVGVDSDAVVGLARGDACVTAVVGAEVPRAGAAVRPAASRTNASFAAASASSYGFASP